MRINPRTVAENAWGRGGTKAYKTNRKNAYYYACSGHGGYVVFPEALSEEENEAVRKYKRHVEHVNALVDQESGEVYGIDYTPVQKILGRNRRFRFPAGRSVEWEAKPVYLFEEDCEWAILEHLTGVRCADRTSFDDERMEEHAKHTFEAVLRFREEEDERQRMLESGEYLLVAGIGKEGKVLAIFRNEAGQEKELLVAIGRYDSVRSERRNTTLNDYQK